MREHLRLLCEQTELMANKTLFEVFHEDTLKWNSSSFSENVLSDFPLGSTLNFPNGSGIFPVSKNT